MYDLNFSETDQDQPLPPPKLAAKMLKTETLKSIQQWQDKYGDAYKKLALGYNYLKMCKKVCILLIMETSIKSLF